MLVIPIIELEKGKCCSVLEDSFGSHLTQLSENAIDFCRFLREEDAKSLFLIDKDSFEGRDNSKNIEYLKLINTDEKINLSVFFYSNFKTIDECQELLDFGIMRLVFDIQHLKKFDLALFIRENMNYRVCLLVNEENALYDFNYFFNIVKSSIDLGFDRILYGNEKVIISFDEYIGNIKRLSKEFGIKISAIYPIKKSEELWYFSNMQEYGVDSIMLSDSLYNVTFPCQKIWRLAESELF